MYLYTYTGVEGIIPHSFYKPGSWSRSESKFYCIGMYVCMYVKLNGAFPHLTVLSNSVSLRRKSHRFSCPKLSLFSSVSFNFHEPQSLQLQASCLVGMHVHTYVHISYRYMFLCTLNSSDFNGNQRESRGSGLGFSHISHCTCHEWKWRDMERSQATAEPGWKSI
jgi:hypothetical protein